MSIRGVIFGVAIGAVVAGVALVGLGSWYTVDEGERAVVLRYGKVSQVAEPGLHFKAPLLDDIERISVRDHTLRFSENPGIEAYSRDQQPAKLALSVTYRVQPEQVQALYTQYGTLANLQTRLLERKILDVAKSVFGQFSATSAIQDRTRMASDMAEAFRKSIEGHPVQLVGLQIEEVGFSPAYEKNIEDRMTAEVEGFTREQNLKTEKINAEIAVLQAQARADSALAEAKARAEAVRIQGEAEAMAIEARGKALRDNPTLIELVKAENWDGKLPQTMLPSSAVPIIGQSSLVGK